MSTTKTCCDAHRKRRERRRAKQGAAFTEYAVDVSATTAAMEGARDAAIDDLPEVARSVLAEELRPMVREHLSGKVLESIGSLIDLLPLAQEALRQDLLAYKPVYHPIDGHMVLDRNGEVMQEVDGDRRKHATALVLKHTVGQSGLAPQPDAPEAAGITVNFSGMPQPVIDATHIDESDQLALEAGDSRQCDVCEEVKPHAEFVANSPRCKLCQAAIRERIDAQVQAMSDSRPS